MKTSEEHKAYCKEYSLKNKEILKKKRQKFKQDNSERIKEQNKKWRDKHSIKRKEKRDAEYKINKQDPDWLENKYEINKKFMSTDKGKLIRKVSDNKRRELKKSLDNNYNKEDIKYTFKLFNNKCFNCPSTTNLEIDHHKPLSKNNGLSRTNAVVLCKNCNSSKHNKDPKDFYSSDKILLLESFDIVS